MPNIPEHLQNIPITGDDESTGDEVKEVFARFGLAVYQAQVLECGIVSALITLEFVPNQNATATSLAEWQRNFDEYEEQSFSQTMGRLLQSLRTCGALIAPLEQQLNIALKRRNSLVHNFFRERAEEFVTKKGRAKMLQEIDECVELFSEVELSLDLAIAPIRRSQGLTDERLEETYRAMIASLDE